MIGRLSAVPKILEVVARTTGMRFTAVARVTDTTWTACAVRDDLGFGLLPGGELELRTTLCDEIRQHHQPIIFRNVAENDSYREHHTPRIYGLQSYVSVPIFRASGEFFGTLCAIDPLPATFDEAIVLKTFQLFAELIASQLETEEQLQTSETELLAARDVATLREQFIAVLGHDIRSPLQAIAMGVQTLKRVPGLPPMAGRVVSTMDRACGRMGGLVDDVLDFARGRLGSGIPVSLTSDGRIGDVLEQVLAEVRASHPQADIVANVAIDRPVASDGPRVAQLFANLLVNAVQNAPAGTQIRVHAISSDEALVLALHNHGTPIPEDRLPGLFLPFTRNAADGKAAGLGLGLYIASEIAKAHGGRLSVQSSREHGTTFTFSMPLAEPATIA